MGTAVQRPRIVIVGGGFGGLWAARALSRVDAEVVVVDRTNHHLFQPLLYQVATAGLSPANIAAPIRSILRKQANIQVRLAEVTGIDRERRELIFAQERLQFDMLILATGARHSYFGHPEWESTAPGLKTLEDATQIREKILMAFERAELEPDPVARRAWLTVAIVGAGPTGVELAGSIAELAHKALARDFDTIDVQSTRIVLIEAGPRILATFSESLSAKAARSLQSLGVEIRTGTRVEAVDDDGLGFGEERLAARTVLWAAGNRASPAGQWLGAETDAAGRVKVGPRLDVPGWEGVFVIGDTALLIGEDGKPLPGVCQTAMQQGTYVGRLIRSRLKGQPDPPPFRYRNKGDMATIGRRSAIAKIGRFEVAGLLAWVLWLVVHIMSLIGFANRLLVLVQWASAYWTFHRGARLITQTEGRRSGEGRYPPP